jgi:Carboxypeptidase regulatory-like domain
MNTLALTFYVIFAIVSGAKSQDQIGGFTRSPNEHIINEIDEPFQVGLIGGLTILPYGGGPLADVLFEIQGPGTDRQIRRCTTDEHGRFKIRRVPEGTYRFKATREGFQSVMGTVIVSKKSPKSNEITITMKVGV